MKKSEAFDLIVETVVNGVNCWECNTPEDAAKNLAYITGMVESLMEAVKDESD